MCRLSTNIYGTQFIMFSMMLSPQFVQCEYGCVCSHLYSAHILPSSSSLIDPVSSTLTGLNSGRGNHSFKHTPRTFSVLLPNWELEIDIGVGVGHQSATGLCFCILCSKNGRFGGYILSLDKQWNNSELCIEPVECVCLDYEYLCASNSCIVEKNFQYFDVLFEVFSHYNYSHLKSQGKIFFREGYKVLSFLSRVASGCGEW